MPDLKETSTDLAFDITKLCSGHSAFEVDIALTTALTCAICWTSETKELALKRLQMVISQLSDLTTTGYHDIKKAIEAGQRSQPATDGRKHDPYSRDDPGPPRN